MVANPERIGDNRQGRIDRADRREEACICHVQIIDPMRLAVEIENRLFRIGSEPQRAGLMGRTPDRYILAEIKRPLEQMRVNIQLAR